MVTRAAIVAEARTWLGTPFHHQAAMKGVGCDCAGLVVGVRVALGLLRPDYWNEPGASEFAGYAMVPDGHSLMRACDRYLTRVEKICAGDVVLVRWGNDPQHLGIACNYRHGGLAIIHAAIRSGKVIETRLLFGKMKFVAAYSMEPKCN